MLKRKSKSCISFLLGGGLPTAWMENPSFQDLARSRKAEIVDISELLWKDLPEAKYGTRVPADRKVTNFEEFDNFLNSVRIQERRLILCGSPVKTRRNEELIVTRLTANNLRYYYFDCGNFCNHLNYNEWKWWQYYWIRRSPLGYRNRSVWFWQRKHVRQPEIAFVASRFIEGPLRIRGMKTSFVRIHARDYEHLLVAEKKNTGNASEEKNLGVFIDQGVPCAFDAIIEKSEPMARFPDYYIGVANFLAKAQVDLGIEQIHFCLHPGNNASKSEIGKIMSERGFSISSGDTFENISKCRIAFTHNSSIVSVVALLKKQLCIVDAPHLNDNPMAKEFDFATKETARIMRCPVYKTDSKEKITAKYDRVVWESYVKRFVKEPGTPTKSFFQVIDEKIP